MTDITIKTRIERWPIANTFKISRGSKTEAVVVVVEISQRNLTGKGECVPYLRYGESPENVIEKIEGWKGTKVQALQRDLPPGAARNALDCAFWDLKAKQEGRPVYELAGLNKPKPLTVTYTISLDTPEKMAEAACKEASRPLLKIKLGKEGDPERLAAVRAAVPKTRLVVDANEGWTADNLSENLIACKNVGIELVEQPLPASNDAALASVAHIIPICADESVFDRASLLALAGKYDAVNIKLDKTGGFTEALEMVTQSKQKGFRYMVGCMVSTSLSMAPAFLVAEQADFVDLDGALLLAKDREHGLRYDKGLVFPPTSALWG